MAGTSFAEDLRDCKTIAAVIDTCTAHDFDFWDVDDFHSEDEYQRWVKDWISESIFTAQNILNATECLDGDYFIADFTMGALGYPHGYYEDEPEAFVEYLINNII